MVIALGVIAIVVIVIRALGRRLLIFYLIVTLFTNVPHMRTSYTGERPTKSFLHNKVHIYSTKIVEHN
jgi:hypothetical protein